MIYRIEGLESKLRRNFARVRSVKEKVMLLLTESGAQHKNRMIRCANRSANKKIGAAKSFVSIWQTLRPSLSQFLNRSLVFHLVK